MISGTDNSSAKRPSSGDLRQGPGFRMRRVVKRPDAALIAEFTKFPLALISDWMNRLYSVDPKIRLITDSARPLIGPACTVRTYPGDNLMVHAALDIAEPGDIIVVDTCGHFRSAVLGSLTAWKGKHRGLGGFLVDGVVRDVEGIRESGVPVCARGTTVIGPLHRGPGEVNYPVQCGGVVVSPGDIVIGDSHGAVVIPASDAQTLLRRIEGAAGEETRYENSVRSGSFNTDWVFKELEGQGCTPTNE